MGKNQQKKKKRKNINSSIHQHKKIGKILIPPLMTLQELGFCSWMNSGLAEMLWACLVITVIPRTEALEIFRAIASLGLADRDQENSKKWSLTHSCLANLPEDLFLKIINLILKHPCGYMALRPLLLIESLPNKEKWENALDVEPQLEDWETLSKAVVHTLDHQSQESTDIRWLTVIFKAALGQLYLLPEMKEKARCIVEYPYHGDIQNVSSFIRATEIVIRSKLEETFEKNWNESFWTECLKKTNCISEHPKHPLPTEIDPKKFTAILSDLHIKIHEHWIKTLSTTAIDARHDAVFGFCFYALALLLEIILGKNGCGIAGRLILRTLVECRISLAYLLFKADPDIWLQFRGYGSGQAKLALLKFNACEENQPNFINQEILEQLANEDIYQEYLNIDLGQWCGSDLRKMAEISNTKADYDNYYGWSSNYIHGQWPALRHNSYTTCSNPLHRLHRVPIPGHRLLDDVISDSICITNKILSDLTKAYPGISLDIKMEDLM